MLGNGWEAPVNEGWYPDSAECAKKVVQYNLAVGFALRDEWEKSSSLINQLYKDNQDVSVQVRRFNFHPFFIFGCEMCIVKQIKHCFF